MIKGWPSQKLGFPYFRIYIKFDFSLVSFIETLLVLLFAKKIINSHSI